MADAITTGASQEEASPFAVSWQKLMMWIFIVTDGLLFAGFLATYGFARLASPQWPDQFEVFDIGFISLMTFVLISSSATMASAVEAAQKGARARVLQFVLLTILGGWCFWECRPMSGLPLSTKAPD